MKIANIVVGPRHRKDMGDLAGLAESIRAEGLLHPIGVNEQNQLVFGERRLRACRDILGWDEIDTRLVHVSSLIAGEYAENEVREDFTPSERVAIAAALEEEIGNRRGQRTDLGQLPHGGAEVPKGKETRSIAAERAGFQSYRSYEDAKKVVESGAPELVAAMDSRKVAVSTAAVIANAPKAEQAQIVARGEKEILHVAKEIRTRKAVERRGARDLRLLDICKRNAELEPEALGVFPVVYADPPWEYDHMMSVSREIEEHYPTMSLEGICALPVADLATESAVLFLWAAPPFLEKAFKVLAAWGFAYRTGMVWDKQKIGMGYYARQQHEHLLIATRGEPLVPDPKTIVGSVVSLPRTEHSCKPDRFYEIIEAMYPKLPKVELFARGGRKGWKVWGNQALAQ